MIYLYAGLGMAMLLPILVGLQSAVYVAELEQGELAMQNSTRKTQDHIKNFRDDQLEIFMSSDPDNCLENAPKGFKTEIYKPGINECAYHSEATLDDLYIARIYNIGAEDWDACIVPENGPEPKCPEEY